ncbi:MAG: ATP-dependent zinc protease [Acidimicrobiales bacterium]
MVPPKRISTKAKTSIGWREWASLPELGVDAVKVKVDTGARTSALHAFRLRHHTVDGRPWVRFEIHPAQHRRHGLVVADAPVLCWRRVRSSNGEVQNRPVILTEIAIGDHHWPIEVTLTDRDEMGFRMLLGRAAVRRRFLVDPGRSYLLGGRDPR